MVGLSSKLLFLYGRNWVIILFSHWVDPVPPGSNQNVLVEICALFQVEKEPKAVRICALFQVEKTRNAVRICALFQVEKTRNAVRICALFQVEKEP